jgi:hypothetical protein
VIRLVFAFICLGIGATLLFLTRTSIVHPLDVPSMYGFAGMYFFVGVALLVWRWVRP